VALESSYDRGALHGTNIVNNRDTRQFGSLWPRSDGDRDVRFGINQPFDLDGTNANSLRLR
jgi:hypothetical protein